MQLFRKTFATITLATQHGANEIKVATMQYNSIKNIRFIPSFNKKQLNIPYKYFFLWKMVEN